MMNLNRHGRTWQRARAVAITLAALIPTFWLSSATAIGHAASARGTASALLSGQNAAPVERGKIVGWPGGNGVIYPTVGFFGASQIFAVGAVHPDGSFEVRFPAVLPVDMLQSSSAQCPTLHSSDPAARNNFTGNYLVLQHGMQIGATHTATSQAFASFTGGANGDTRTGFLYTTRNTTLTGYCDRTITLGGYTVDFRQNFDLHAHKGWNEVVADLSVPQPGHLVTNLKVGSNRAMERWFFFRPAAHL